MKALAACVYRQLSLPTFKAITEVLSTRQDWRLLVETGDALISRARSTAASQWVLHYPDDEVLVMTDDDFYFTPEGLEAVAGLACEVKGIAAGVTPLRSGEYTAIVSLDGTPEEPWRDPACPPMPIRWAGGLVAYHRTVFERLSHTLPLLHKRGQLAPFWPFFAPAMKEIDGDGVYLSEDYACHERARQLGIPVWVQPACQVAHLAEVLVTSRTMDTVRGLYADATLGGTVPGPQTPA